MKCNTSSTGSYIVKSICHNMASRQQVCGWQFAPCPQGETYSNLFKLFLFFILFISFGYCEIKSGKCDPYYVSIKYKEVNSHVGPGKNYKIAYKYVMKTLPVLVTAKYDNWRKTKDPEGNESWIHKVSLSSERFVMALEPCELMTTSKDSAKVVAKIKKNVIMKLLCARGNWCEVEIDYKNKKYKGWIKKKIVFGVFDNETS